MMLDKTEKHKPYPVATACKEHQAHHRKTLYPTDLPTKEYTLLLQVEPSNVYPLQAQQWPVIGIGTIDQFQ